MLEVVARSDTPRGVSDLARELELTRSNVHRTLQTLATAGYVRQDPGGGYECTLKLFELSSTVMERIDVRHCAAPHARRLCDLTEESIHLATLDGSDVVYLDKVESPQPIRAYSSVGGRAPAHCVASGKALLSRAPREVVERLVAAGLERYTELTITEPDALRTELDDARRSGCAVNRGEWRPTVGGIAAVVFRSDGEPEAAIGVSGPVERVLEREAALREAVLDTAGAISRELGCRTYPARAGRGY
mgnify:CR=1 FL=1